MQASLPVIFADVVADEMALNSALPRTVVGILFRPGYLTNEFLRGRVVRYIPPLRLYLLSSVLFFLTLSFHGLAALDRLAIQSAETASAPMTADSVQALEARLDELMQVDTAAMPALARPAIRQAIAQAEASLARARIQPDTATPDVATADTAAADITPPDTGSAGSPGDTGAVRPDTAGMAPGPAPAPVIPAADAPLPRGQLQPWAMTVRRNVAGSPLERSVERKLAQLGHLPQREAVRQFLANLLEYAPHMMFVLLPVFALFLKLLYIRRGRYYAEHFVFALHVHAFFFLMFFLILLLSLGAATPFIVFWMMAYVWLAMKRVYRQGWFRTTLKWWVLGFSYMFLLTFGLLGLVFSAIIIG